MSNTQYKPSEGKREEFRKYLEKNGVMDALTKVLVSLYEESEKPSDALGYIRDKLAVQAGLETYNEMKDKKEELQKQVTDLQNELDQLKSPQTVAEISDATDQMAAPLETDRPAESIPEPTETPATEATATPVTEEN